MTDCHHKLFRLAGFSLDDPAADLSKWRRTAERLGVDQEDVRYAVESWLPEQWNLDLVGVRRVLGVLLKELMALCASGQPQDSESTRLYTALPFPPALLLAVQLAGGGGFRMFAPDLLLNVALNAVFHKTPDWLDSALGRDLPNPSCRRCGLNQIRIGAQTGGVIPLADATWTAGVFCDEAPKVEEYLACLGTIDRPALVSRLPQDAAGHMSPADRAERAEYLKRQLEHGLNFLKQTLGVTVTDRHLRAGIYRWQRYAFKLASLNSLMLRSDPPPMGGFENALFALPRMMPFSAGLDDMETALQTGLMEARHRCSQGRGVVTRGAPRLLIYQVPFSQPQVSRLFESNGMALVGSLTVALKSPLSPVRPDEDALDVLSRGWGDHPEILGLDHEIAAMCDVVERYRPDGLIMGLFDFDRRLGTLQPLATRLIQERTGCPAFYLEGDIWGPRELPVLQLGDRLENIRGIISKNGSLSRHNNELKGNIPKWDTCSPV